MGFAHSCWCHRRESSRLGFSAHAQAAERLALVSRPSRRKSASSFPRISLETRSHCSQRAQRKRSTRRSIFRSNRRHRRAQPRRRSQSASEWAATISTNSQSVRSHSCSRPFRQSAKTAATTILAKGGGFRRCRSSQEARRAGSSRYFRERQIRFPSFSSPASATFGA